TLTSTTRDMIATLVRDLGDTSFKTRNKATAELSAFGMIAVSSLREAALSPDREVARRAEECLRHIEQKDLRVGVPAAAAHLLAVRKPPGAVDVLLAFLPSAENDSVAAEVQAALGVVALQDGKPEKALLAALGDPVPARRMAAVDVLCKAGLAS